MSVGVGVGESVAGELIASGDGYGDSGGPGALIALAVKQDLSIDKLERLMALKKDWDAQQARKAFFFALSQFQAVVPEIAKEDAADCGRAGKRKYSSLGTIARQIKGAMGEAGLSYRFKQSQDDAGTRITITCVISHVDGHSEETSLTAGADISGGKNPIQSIASTVTYLQRYTLVGSLGLTTVDDDDDGAHVHPAVVSEEERAKAAKSAEIKAKLFSGQPQQPQTVTTVEVMPNGPHTITTEPAKAPAVVDTQLAGTITDHQRKRIEELYDLLGVDPESRDRALANRKANSLRNLSTEQAGDILAKLEGARLNRELESDKSNLDDAATSAALAGPCSQHQIDQAKALVQELEQMQPGVSAKIKAKLKAAGMQKLSELTIANMDSLLQQLSVRNIEAFFAANLTKGTLGN